MKRILATVLALMMMVGCASVSAAESYDIVFVPKGVADFWSIVAAGQRCRNGLPRYLSHKRGSSCAG